MIHYILFWLVAILALFGIAFLSQEPVQSHGAAHPMIQHLSAGGDGLERLGKLSYFPYFFQLLTMTLIINLVVLGLSSGANRARAYLFLGGIWVLMITVWSGLYFSYQNYLNGGKVDYYLGFPEPTAWMLYGVWTSAALLAIFFSVGFRHFILSESDEQRFQEILSTYKKRGEK